ncbi:MAG: YHS domain-containing protein [Chitinophagaceae bacterium]|nr:YHS domain-containing protein [Anaerolineae bacterium]
MDDFFYLCGLMVALLVVSNLWVYWRVLLPLRKLAAQATALTGGDLTVFQSPCGGIGEIDQLRRAMAGMVGHIRRTQQQTSVYRDALTNGQEAERARIAHELHDDTTQALIAIAQSLDLAGQWIGTERPQAAEMLKGARIQAVEAVGNLRRLIADLRPPALEELGLVPALRMLNLPDIVIDVEVEGQQRRLDEHEELALFRVAQEAVRNSARHGLVHQIDMQVAYLKDRTRLVVTDDGKGFDLARMDTLAAEGHYGLLGIQERIQHLNGTVAVRTAPKQGTRIQVEIPLKTDFQPSDVVRDPVCSAIIQPQQAYGSTVYEGERYYFCCPVCQGAFQRDPQLYLVENHNQSED